MSISVQDNFKEKVMSRSCFILNFCDEKSPFCGATAALCFRLQLTLPMVFKARVNPSSPMCCSHSQLWISKPRHAPILYLGTVRLLLEWPPNVTSRITGTGRIWTQDLMAQSLILYQVRHVKVSSRSLSRSRLVHNHFQRQSQNYVKANIRSR